jgi:cell wall-associated NlpC family hydrolase
VRRLGRPQAVPAVLAVMALVALLVGVPGTALAAPPPPAPPPNPSDSQLNAGHAAVTQRAAQVASLTGQLSALDDKAAAIQLELSGRQEQANRALVDQQNAKSAAEEASKAATAARQATDSASADVDALRTRVDEFLSASYQQGLDIGPLGLLTAPGGPQGVLDRSAFADMIAEQQQQALDSLQRAMVARVNADSLARKAEDDAKAKAALAQQASAAAAGAVAQVQSQAKAQAAQLAQVQVQRDAVNAQLSAAVANDAGLRAQRARFTAWQQQQEAAAAGRVAGQLGPIRGSGAVRTVINRAMSQLGVQYAWGGGNGRGPTLGVHDGGIADIFGDYRRVGFDCSGLMIYAFAGVGVALPHYSGYQYTSGRQVPVAARQPGDLLFYSEGGAIGHVALYVGNGMMIEAPYSGAAVRLAPMRFSGLMPNVTRMV